MKHIAALLLFGYALLLVYPTRASAEVYRWVDRDGNPHFGDRAAVPAANKAEQLPIKTANTGPDPEAEKARQQLREQDRFRQQQQQSQVEQTAQQRQQRQQLQQRCKALADQIRADRETAVFFRYDASGNRVLWTSDERIAYREQLQATQQQYCSE